MSHSLIRRAIPVLVYEDIPAAHDYLVRVFGLGAGRVDHDPEGRAVHAEVRTAENVIYLHRVAPEFKVASPAALGADTAGVDLIVDNVEDHYAHATSEGAVIVYPPADMPYGFREYGARVFAMVRYSLEAMQSVDALVTAVRTALSGAKTLREVKMFGGIGFMLNGNMVAAASKRGLLLRVGKDRQRDALARPGVRPMVMRGRTMEGYLYVDLPALTESNLQAWLQIAVDFVKTLPPKAPGAKARPTGNPRR